MNTIGSGNSNPIFPVKGTRAEEILNMLCRGSFAYKPSAEGDNVKELIAIFSLLKTWGWPLRESYIDIYSVTLTVCSLEQWARRVALDRML